MRASYDARQRIRDKMREQKEEEELRIHRLLELTAVDHPLQAMNLDNLLKRQWNEQEGNYCLLSKINKRSQQKKLMDLCFNRY